MNKIAPNIALSIIASYAFILLFPLHIIAQTNNLPTPDQIQAKLHRLDSLKTYRKEHQGLFDIQQIDKKQSADKLSVHQGAIDSAKERMMWQNGGGKLPTSIHPANPVILTTGLEQDCANGIAVCSQSYTQTTSYTGHGSVQEVNNACLLGQETNSVWYIFTIQTSGNFGFTLQTSHDYDFALYNITTMGCAGVPTATPVRCNFSATFGNTGMSPAGTNPSEPATGPPWSTELAVTAGQTYALIIDNWTADANGYTLNFTTGAGYASIYDNTPPTLSSEHYYCNSKLTLYLSEKVKCSSIDAGDFSISPAGFSISSASGGGNCSSGSLTDSVQLTLSGTPTSGTYTVHINTGSDANTLLDKCDNPMSTSQTISFDYLGAVAAAASSPTICSGGSSGLSATNISGATYAWTPTGTLNNSAIYNPTATPSSSTTYQCAITYGGCTSTASTSVSVTAGPVVSITPMNPIICSGTTTLSASSTIAGSSFNWTGAYTGTGATTPAVGAGTYNVTCTAPSGCASVNTATSTVSLASSPPANTCDIYYITSTGTGDGTSIANAGGPSTLTTILSNVACSGATVKMAVGVYSISDALSINSNTTLEGGFNNSFTTKTSDMSGGANSTTIRRTNASPDGGSGNNFTAIKVAASATNFRLQDLRIELPGASPVASNPVHANGSKYTNYGIYLGSGCTNYNIVRCYIDAGAGSDGSTGTNGTNMSGHAANGSTGQNADNSGIAGSGGGSGASAGGNGGGGGGYGLNGSNGVRGKDYNNTYIGTIGVNTTAGSSGAGGNYDNNESSCGGCDNHGGCSTNGCGSGNRGKDGVAGNNGANGATGANGTAASFSGGYFVAGSSGANGALGNDGSGGGGGGGGGGQSCGCQCICFCNDDMGAGGGGGGAGGAKSSAAGTGGTAAGGAFGVFSVSAGAGGNVKDCYILATAGTGGSGGLAGTGQTGGTGGNGGSQCDGGGGGNGGNGGKGGNSGAGGKGADGIAYKVCNLVSTTCTDAGYTNFNLTAEPIIVSGDATHSYNNCTSESINMTTTAGSPTWTGSDAPLTGSGSPQTVAYTSTGRKTVVMSGNTYTDFNNIITNAPSAGSINASMASGCPGTYYFSSSLGSTPGFTFNWSSTGLPAGVTATPANATADGTNYTITNTTGSNQTVTIQLTVSSECCGALTPITYSFTVYALPAAPTTVPTSSTICPGSCTILNATAPAGASFDWYNAASGGSLLQSGASYTVCPASSTSYYVEATSSNGCVSASRTSVPVTVTGTTPPTVSNVTLCSPGTASLSVTSPVSGDTYNWYSSCGAGFLGSGPTYSAYVSATTTFYVTVTEPGCNESSCTPVTVTISGGAPTSVTWNGATSTDWFDASNWTPSCLPQCGTDVTIPSGTPNAPDITFNATPAACKSITIANGTSLTFSVKSELDVCGNFTQNGAVIGAASGYGKVVFMGSSPQDFTCTSTGSGDLNDVILDNTASPPLLTIKQNNSGTNKDLNVDNSFTFQSGIVITEGARKLVIKNASASALTGGSVVGYVDGRLTRYVSNNNSYDFPVGGNPNTATAPNYPYELMHIDFTSMTGMNDLTVKFENPSSNVINSIGSTTASPGLPLVDAIEGTYTPILDCGGTNTGTGVTGMAGIWTVLANAGTATYNMALYGRNYDNASTGPAWSILKRIAYSNCATSPSWILDGVHSNYSNTSNVLTASRTGMSGFSQFAIANTTVPLPIELLNFDVTCDKDHTIISWTTATESNNNHFTLERSCDNLQTFTPIATIPGAGNSSSLRQYSYTDNNYPGGSTCYYRLSQTDNDGHTTYFNTVAANCKFNAGFQLTNLLPNPATNELHVLFTDNVNENVTITLTDVLGQKLLNKEVLSKQGLNTTTLDLSSFSNGVYFLRIDNGKKLFIRKVVKDQ